MFGMLLGVLRVFSPNLTTHRSPHISQNSKTYHKNCLQSFFSHKEYSHIPAGYCRYLEPGLVTSPMGPVLLTPGGSAYPWPALGQPKTVHVYLRCMWYGSQFSLVSDSGHCTWTCATHLGNTQVYPDLCHSLLASLLLRVKDQSQVWLNSVTKQAH
jgi:hypothetical protein